VWKILCGIGEAQSSPTVLRDKSSFAVFCG
jgi:hypothetical protein